MSLCKKDILNDVRRMQIHPYFLSNKQAQYRRTPILAAKSPSPQGPLSPHGSNEQLKQPKRQQLSIIKRKDPHEQQQLASIGSTSLALHISGCRGKVAELAEARLPSLSRPGCRACRGQVAELAEARCDRLFDRYFPIGSRVD